MFVKGAPEGVIERCSYVRVGSAREAMTEGMRKRIIEKVRKSFENKHVLCSSQSVEFAEINVLWTRVKRRAAKFVAKFFISQITSCSL